MRLTNTKIFRAGVSERTWKSENTSCDLAANRLGLSLNFDIASKGGGRTAINVGIGSDDLPEILAAVARVPGGPVLLADAAATAANRLNSEIVAAEQTLVEAEAEADAVQESTYARYRAASADANVAEHAEWKQASDLANLVTAALGRVEGLGRVPGPNTPDI